MEGIGAAGAVRTKITSLRVEQAVRRGGARWRRWQCRRTGKCLREYRPTGQIDEPVLAVAQNAMLGRIAAMARQSCSCPQKRKRPARRSESDQERPKQFCG